MNTFYSILNKGLNESSGVNINAAFHLLWESLLIIELIETA